MKLKKLVLSSLLGVGLATSAWGQELPEHPMYVLFGTEKPLNEYFDEWITRWEKGGELTEDDNFFISRVRLKKRFSDNRTQVNKALTTDRKVAWWCPIGESSKLWGPLPRYNFNADNFSMWQYLDVHANWSNVWFRVPGAFADVAHKNGVETGCLKFCDWGSSITSSSADGKIFAKIAEKDSNDKFKYARKLVQLLNYYGIDGIGVNPEGNWQSALAYQFQDFLAECHIEAAALGMNFRVDWYDSNNNEGALGFGSNELADRNKDWFQHSEKKVPVTDVFMLNYNWQNNQLANSAAKAKSLGRSPWDVYASYDLEGRGWKDTQGTPSPTGGWVKIAQNESSIIFWGNHARNMLFGSASEFGGSDLNVQRYYQEKQELAFTGGSRNPANTPELANKSIINSYASLQQFHGVSKLIPARSTLTELPFITRFNLGNGMFFKNQGVTTFDHKWYNLGMQDYLPTWRWWVLDDSGNVPADAIKCDFTFDDAWFGGSCLKLHGATKKSNIRMFKTQFTVNNNNFISLRYKVKNSVKTNLSLIWTEDGTTYKSYPIPDAEAAGGWAEFKVKASVIGMGGKSIAALGFAVENTPADYEILLGELSVISTTAYAPVTPTITKVTYEDRRYNSADFKLIFKSKDKVDPLIPIYNDEVDTWYFEVYCQAEGAEPVLCTATTSWAAYVVDAPVIATAEKVRFGVRAVAPDGKTFSEYAWTDYLAKEITTVDKVEVDKSIIKPGETFTVKYADPYHSPAKWEVIDPVTETAVKTADNVTALTLSIDKIGVYDLRITSGSNITFSRGAIQITPEAVGALPIIESLVVDKAEANINDNVKATYKVTRLGEGTVSRGLRIEDPNLFKVPADNLFKDHSYSVGIWLKPDQFICGPDGIGLLNRCDVFFTGGPWMASTRGDFWVSIRETEEEGTPRWNLGEVSYTCYGMPEINWGNMWENPSYPMLTSGYALQPGMWSHLVISHDKETNTMRMFFNGKKVKEETVQFNTHTGGSIYVGLANNRRTSYTGVIDELQIWNKALANESEVAQAMLGYEKAPEALVGYYTFEKKNEDESFDNKGSLGADEKYNGEVVIINETDRITPRQAANNGQLGCPVISGTLPIVTTAKWAFNGATGYNASDKSATATYGTDGKYTIGLSLINDWGSTSVDQPVIIVKPSGIDEANTAVDFNLYPNPFVEKANISFAEGGNYVINVFSTDGQLVNNGEYSVVAGEIRQLSFDAEKGMYYVVIMKDGKCVKSFKVGKQ